MFRVQYCCCGCSLKTGTLLIILFSLIMLIISVAPRIYLSITSQGDEHQKQQSKLGWEALKLGMNLYSSIAGLYGLYKRKLKHLNTYLGFELFDILMQTFRMIILPFYVGKTKLYIPEPLDSYYHILAEGIREVIRRGYVDWKILTLEEVVFEEIFHSIACVLRLYFFIVGYSYYSRLEEELQNEEGESA